MPASATFRESVLSEIETALTALTRNPRIRGLHRLLSAQSGVELDRPSYVALAMLDAGPMRISELADACGVDVSTMSRLVDRLLARRLIERETSPDDRRVSLVQASAQGREVQHAMRAWRSEALKRLLGSWTRDEREQFAELLSRFVRDADQYMREKGL
jgi:DNA-binding MarR family transcriptional regulator